MPRFEYLAPKTIEEACSALAAHGERAVAVAGGTDLFVKMKQRKVLPQYVVSLKGIPGLDGIAGDDTDGLRLGALVTLQSLKNSPVVKRRCGILAQAAAVEASIQIRNIATLGGNIVNASPAADAPLALVAAGARIVVVGAGGERELLLEDLFMAPGKTCLRPGELVKEILVPPLPPGSGAVYLKHALRRSDIAIVAVAVVLTLKKDACTAVRIALGSVAPTIVRAGEAEALLINQVITEDLADAAALTAAKAASPIDDIRRSADYRVQGIVDTTKLAIVQALADARTAGL
ncbi:MAG: xanthine dehydrogenase family protein subunit M [Xanthobacteraceae bacterium]